ncbi:roadblock/LC7 domain-containing protein [Streptomyces sp. NPDC054841]
MELNSKQSHDLSTEARDFTWLLNRFAGRTSGVADAIAVSSDGLLIAASGSRERADSDRLAAIVSGMTSLAGGASGSFGLGPLNKVIVDLAEGYLLVMAVGAASVLAVIAAKSASLGTIAYEMTLFANQAGAVLTPQLINELKNFAQL